MPRQAFEGFGLPRNTPIFEPAFRGEGVVRSDDITRDARYGLMAPHYGMPPGHPRVRSFLAVPVLSRTRQVIGGLFFGHGEAGVFTERVERLVVGVAAQAGTAVDNARLFEERQQLLDRERAARAEAERMGKLKDEFLATLSHELRTPLSAILGWAQVMALRPMPADDLQNAVHIIERNARAQTRLIEDLLDMSRITSGQLRLDVQPLQPAAFIDAALETMRHAAESKGVRLEKVLDPRAGPISGDPGRLQQVVWNLLSNAIKFTPRGGKVQVVLARVNSHIELSVSDTGAGIEPDFLPHIFDRFRQADGSMTRKHGGLGIGLSIAKHLVEMHGGSLVARSAGPDQGTTFTAILPLAAVQQPVSTKERAHPTAVSDSPKGPAAWADLSGLTVIAVDDEPDARELMRRVLQDCGARVVTAGSSREALAALQLEAASVLLTDIGMPESDGFDLLRQVRALGPERGGNIPAVALTAFARPEDRTRALRAGFRMHLSKPVDAYELCITIASVAGRIRT
jgi:signal transduction histidine kinase/CheY-like chemotaxis protein